MSKGWLLATVLLAISVFASCNSNDLQRGAGNRETEIIVEGQSITQDAVNCFGSPVFQIHFGLTLPNIARAPLFQGRVEDLELSEWDRKMIEENGPPPFITAAVNYAAYAEVSGVEFYGYPVVGAVNESWIVIGPVDSVARTVAADRGVSVDQVRGDGARYWSDVFNYDVDDWDPIYATMASRNKYQFETTRLEYRFPDVQTPEGIINSLRLYKLGEGFTLAACDTMDPTQG